MALQTKPTLLRLSSLATPTRARNLLTESKDICLCLVDGADIYQIAKNCRTSVEMIQKFYAAHLKNTLDASNINKRKPRRRSDAKAVPEARVE